MLSSCGVSREAFGVEGEIRRRMLSLRSFIAPRSVEWGARGARGAEGPRRVDKFNDSRMLPQPKHLYSFMPFVLALLCDSDAKPTPIIEWQP